MPQTINTNVVSLNAQRNLNMSQSSLATSMQRLSSGLRVNSAKDDAAGLAIAERMNTQVRGLNVAARNANDGISLAQTAEGALGKVGDMLQRMRELAVQAANATNSTDDRKALQSEVAQLRDEVDRVAKGASFNGKKLLDGSFTAATFQIGANSGDSITVGSLTDTRASQLSSVAYSAVTVAGIDLDSATPTITTLTAIADGALDVTVNGVTYELGAVAAADSPRQRMGQVAEAINRKTSDSGVSAFVIDKGNGTVDIALLSAKVNPATGVAYLPTFGAGFTAASTGIAPPTFVVNTAAQGVGIETLNVETDKDAWIAIKKLDSALDQVNHSRGTLGAVQSRFENTVANIQIQAENLSAARGRIMDADFAMETANLSRAQILQQAGTAMVAQANQLPQQVLALLRT
ncbi:MAG: flagellin [Burkholderiaceae bacterium]|nr:flagellin [Burkholderiaceae bacterium]